MSRGSRGPGTSRKGMRGGRVTAETFPKGAGAVAKPQMFPMDLFCLGQGSGRVTA